MSCSVLLRTRVLISLAITLIFLKHDNIIIYFISFFFINDKISILQSTQFVDKISITIFIIFIVIYEIARVLVVNISINYATTI